ncbi:DinB family protein [Olivibacter ginsenosidimutans]
MAVQTRKNFMLLMDELTIDDVNTIPHGFNNNIAWNFGHLVVSQQKLCYTLAGLPLKIDEQFLIKYQRGSKPEAFVCQEEIDQLKKLAFSLLVALAEDLKSKIFRNFTPTKLHYGIELLSIQDAVNYFPVHDALHLGFATAIKKAMKAKN